LPRQIDDSGPRKMLPERPDSGHIADIRVGPNRVKMRKSRIEHKWSGLAQRSDLTADMLNRQQRANSRLMRRGKSRPIDQPVDADEYGSFSQSRFPKALDHQLRSFW
jgi:hypothetical protein